MLRKFDCYAIVGPTASGKTSISIKLAKKVNGEVIGLDSRQIFRGMEIGTAQPSLKEMDGISHHLIGSLDPWMKVSAGYYAQKVFDKIQHIKSKGKVPIICGGSGLYYRAVVKGLFDESSTNLLLREKLELEYDNNPYNSLKKLNKIDPDYSEKVHINNKKRLVRALEIYEITGKTPSQHYKIQRKNNILKFFTVYLNWDREELNQRIINRTKNMISEGWFEEVKKLNLMKRNNSFFKRRN
jgi:tRNA dimethylallyltransferase